MTFCSSFKSDYEELYRWKYIQSLFPIVPYDFYVDYFEDIIDRTKPIDYEVHHTVLKYRLVKDGIEQIILNLP